MARGVDFSVAIGGGSSMQRAGRTGRGAREWLAEASDAVISVIFPAECRICEDVLTRASRVPICEKCLSSFVAPPEKKCEICWQPIAAMRPAEGAPLVCRACQEKKYAFER